MSPPSIGKSKASLGLLIVLQLLAIQTGTWASPIRIVTTTEDLAAIAREVGGPFVTVESLAKGWQDPHFLEPRPSLIMKAARADLFVQIGLGLETGWVPSLLLGARNPRILPGGNGFVDVSEDIEVLDLPSKPLDRSHGDVHNDGNPHYWLDPENGKKIARQLANRLVDLLPDQTDVIRGSLDSFIRRLDRAIVGWQKQLEPYRDVRVVTYHNSWIYLAYRFNLNIIGFIEPKPGIPPSPVHLSQLIDLMRQTGVKAIIMEPFFSRSIPEMLSRETGAVISILPPSVGSVEEVKTYIQLFDLIINRLTKDLR